MAHIQTDKPVFTQQWIGAKTVWNRFRNAYIQMTLRRRTKRDLSRKSKRDLKDIGLTQSDMRGITSLPLSAEAAAMLAILASRKSTRR